MLLEEDIRKILDQLNEGNLIKLAFDGADVFIRILDNSSKVSLVTSVYHGGNYIPSSVRRCLSHKAPGFPPPFVRTFLTIDEHQFRIHLNYLGHTQELTTDFLKELLEEFSRIADNWRLYLDENDKNDLIYVRVK
jgi:hypothetical protein